jgi:predicted transcriptional regulator
VSDARFAVTIISSYLRHQSIETNKISDLIDLIRRVISQLRQPARPREVLIPAVPIRRSVHRDYVVCLDCGFRGRTLRRHISARHGYTRAEYFKRWGLPDDYHLVAPSYSDRRSKLAKSLGLGRRRETKPGSTVSSSTAPEIVGGDQGSDTTPTQGGSFSAAGRGSTIATQTVPSAPARRRRSRTRAS